MEILQKEHSSQYLGVGLFDRGLSPKKTSIFEGYGNKYSAFFSSSMTPILTAVRNTPSKKIVR